MEGKGLNHLLFPFPSLVQVSCTCYFKAWDYFIILYAIKGESGQIDYYAFALIKYFGHGIRVERKYGIIPKYQSPHILHRLA